MLVKSRSASVVSTGNVRRPEVSRAFPLPTLLLTIGSLPLPVTEICTG